MRASFPWYPAVTARPSMIAAPWCSNRRIWPAAARCFRRAQLPVQDLEASAVGRTMIENRVCDRPLLGRPILDRDPELRAAAQRSGFTCLDQHWRGVSASYRFQCGPGHVFQRTLQTFGKARRAKCRECVAEECLATLHALSAQSGVLGPAGRTAVQHQRRQAFPPARRPSLWNVMVF